MLGKHEAAYIRRAWYGRGLHYHSNQTFATKYVYIYIYIYFFFTYK
jgi:hypothetical protein